MLLTLRKLQCCIVNVALNSISLFYSILLQGTLSGMNEYVVYNAYRVMPEYLIEYSTPGLPSVYMRAVTTAMAKRKTIGRARRGRTKKTK